MRLHAIAYNHNDHNDDCLVQLKLLKKFIPSKGPTGKTAREKQNSNKWVASKHKAFQAEATRFRNSSALEISLESAVESY
jgi:hypothetical protein